MKFLRIWVLILLTFSLSAIRAQAIFERGLGLLPGTLKLEIRDSALNFIAMGDWGKDGDEFQKAVAEQMANVAASARLNFVISTGDNFYPNGIKDLYDPQFKTSFEDIYTQKSLQIPWYVTLGNHDYISNPQAQIAYSSRSKLWVMPDRYYSKTLNINGDSTQQVLFLFIDTNPFVPRYHKKKEYSRNVRTQNPGEQKKWIRKNLSNVPGSVKWKIIVGHHPIYTGGKRRIAYDTKAVRKRLKGVFKEFDIDAYISGHEHNLQHIKTRGKTHHFISGAASEALPAKLLRFNKMSAAIPGFMLFSLRKDELLMHAISHEGEVLYKTSIKKE